MGMTLGLCRGRRQPGRAAGTQGTFHRSSETPRKGVTFSPFLENPHHPKPALGRVPVMECQVVLLVVAYVFSPK